MSEHHISVRLNAADYEVLRQVMLRHNLDRSEALRQAVRLAGGALPAATPDFDVATREDLRVLYARVAQYLIFSQEFSMHQLRALKRPPEELQALLATIEAKVQAAMNPFER